MSREKRQHERIEWLSPGAIYVSGDPSPIPCVVSNISRYGAKISRVEAAMLPNEFTLDIWPSKGQAAWRCRVIWRKNDRLGVRFQEPYPIIKDEWTASNNREREAV
jgi:hypothetical protein